MRVDSVQVRAVRTRSVRHAVLVSVLADCCCVLVFVVIGRASHTKGESLAGIASTAWPFLAGLAGGWLVAMALVRRPRPVSLRPYSLWPAGVSAWLGTVALGMVLRVVSGQGIAPAFVLVALVFLGLFLLGWRVLARLAARRR